MKKMLRTYVCYDKKGEKVEYCKYLDSKKYNAVYMVYNVNEIKQLMTLDIYEKTEYVQELKYDDKTCKYEDGTFRDMKEWKYANTKKHYIHDMWK